MEQTISTQKHPALLPAAGFGAAGACLLLFALAAPGHAAFFPLLSLWCSAGVFALGCAALRVAGVRLKKFHWVCLGAVWLTALVHFAWTLSRRDFIYIWDYVNYLARQYEAEAAFAQSAGAGLRFIFGSLADDYTNFITLFTEFPFCLTDRTGDSYALCQAVCVLPSLLTMLAGVIVKTGQLLRVKNQRLYFLIGLSWTASFPFLRMSAILAQPDWFGLIFAFGILVLTLDYRFDRLEAGRAALLFLATAAIILSRRWYLYFVVGYYFAYALLVLAGSLRLARQGERKAAARRVRNLLAFGLLAMAAMIVLLWPMVSHILRYDYADRYAYYNGGGMLWETALHLARLGLMNLMLIGLGLGFLLRKRRPALAPLAGMELVLSFVLFTRVQNTGSHQFLLFLPGYFLLFLAGAAALAEGIRRRTALKLGFWGVTVVLAMSVRCSPLTSIALPGVLLDHFPLSITDDFEREDKLTYDRSDLAQIEAITDWIDQHCAEGEFSYMIPHDMLYCPDHFKNCRLPEKQLEGKLAYGFSIPGTHKFPVEFLEAKYVLTAEPFPQTYVGNGELSIRLNAQFLAVRDAYFTLAETFDMGNGTVFTVWERTVPPSREEAEYYLSAFAAEDAKYPELFHEVVEAWLAAHGL